MTTASQPEFARLKIGGSYALTVLGLGLVVLPWGWGFITLVTSACSFLLARAVHRHDGSRKVVWARNLSPLPVVVYGIFLLAVIPTRTSVRSAEALVVSTGEVEESLLRHLSHEGELPFDAVILEVQPCGSTIVVRTSSQRDEHLDQEVPSMSTRECLESLSPGATLDVQVQLTRRWLSQDVKSFSILSIGDCALSEADHLAVVTVEFCEDWSHERE